MRRAESKEERIEDSVGEMIERERDETYMRCKIKMTSMYVAAT
jgi:hypothetical protein